MLLERIEMIVYPKLNSYHQNNKHQYVFSLALYFRLNRKLRYYAILKTRKCQPIGGCCMQTKNVISGRPIE